MAVLEWVIQEWVASGLFEIGVCEMPIVDNDLAVRSFRYETVCALSADDPLAQAPVLTPRLLSGRAFVVMGPEHMTHSQTRDAFHAAGAEWKPRVHTHLFENKLAFVKRGMGVALLDPFTVAFDRGGGFVARPFEPVVSLDMAIITARDRPLSALGRRFLEALDAEMAAFASPLLA